MFFKNYYNSVSDSLQAKYRAYERPGLNPADKGELCEVFIKDFLTESFGNIAQVFRGGNIVNSKGGHSKQIDIVLCRKDIIKIFGDKGIYPVETLLGAYSITATLSWNKLIDCIAEFQSIPQSNWVFTAEEYVPKEIAERTIELWKSSIPYKVVFAFKGNIDPNWPNKITEYVEENNLDIRLLPDLIFVNQNACIIKEKHINEENGTIEFSYQFNNHSEKENNGLPFHLSVIQFYEYFQNTRILIPEYTAYFNADNAF